MSESDKIYSFEDFTLDTANKVLRKNCEIITLTPKVYDTLYVLITNAGKLLEKDELMKQIWQDHFVEENNLAFNIKRLRNSLGDDANKPKFIETVPRRGYRFIADVSESVEPQTSVEKTFGTNNSAFVFGRTQLFVALFIIVLICSIGYAAWFWQKKSSQTTPIFAAEYSLTKLSETGKVFHSAISPNGKLLAYTSRSGNKESLWLRQLDSGTNTEIISPGEDFYFGLKFSTDGETLYFVKQVAGASLNIHKVSIYGGVPQKIIDNTQGKISLSPDNKKIAFIRYDEGVFDKNKIVIADTSGKNEQVIKESEPPNVFWTVDFSPDGKLLAAAYGRSSTASQEMSLVEIEIASGEQKEISERRFFNIFSANWLPNKSGLIISASRKINEPIKLWQVDYPKGKTTLVKNDSLSFDDLDLTQAGDKLSATTITPDFHLYLGSVDNPTDSKEIAQARDEMAFTPDGKIVYASDAGGPEDIWIMNSDGTNQKQLTTDKDLDAYPIVSSDNRYIYFSSNRTGMMQVWRMKIDGTEQTQITKDVGGSPISVSADGKTLYFYKNEDFSVRKLNLETNIETKILTKKSKPFIAFSPIGDKFAFVSKTSEKDIYKIEVMDLSNNSVIKSLRIEKFPPYYLSWLNDGKTIAYLIDESNEKTSLWQQNLDGGKPKLIASFGKEDFLDCKFSPDGKYFAIIRGNWKHDAVLLNGLR